MLKNYTYALLIILLFANAGCKSAEKYFREGDYNQAIEIAVKKLQNNPSKEEYVLLLEESFKRANAQDLSYIHSLNLEGNPDRWEEIYNVYQAISRRQNKINPLLPLRIESENRNAVFEMVDVVAELINAKKNAINYLIASAKEKLKTKNKYDAREAYYELLRANEFNPNHSEIKSLLDEAVTIGTNQVEFSIDNRSNTTLSNTVMQSIGRIEPYPTSGTWYIITGETQQQVDLKLILRINKIEALPEVINTNNYEETRQVEDGWTYVYDTNGNQVLDSLGNPIKTIKYKWISAYVSETFQEKIASVDAELRYTDSKGKIIKSIPVKGDAVFQNYYAIATGYYDALSPASKEKLGGKPLPFPSNDELIVQAMETMESLMQNAMQNNNENYLNN